MMFHAVTELKSVMQSKPAVSFTFGFYRNYYLKNNEDKTSESKLVYLAETKEHLVNICIKDSKTKGFV